MVTWGDLERGGEAPKVDMAVCQVCACGDGFACLDRLGRTTCWGDPSLSAKLEGVQRLSASSRSFAALMKDGSVRVWGERHRGISTTVPGASDVVEVVGSSWAFSALTSEGQVVAWGDLKCGGDLAEVRDQLLGVVKIFA